MVILYPVTTEKAIGLIGRENKLTFVVERTATKRQIREHVERQFEVKVEKVTVMNTMEGKKKALVRLAKGFKADDIAARLRIA